MCFIEAEKSRTRGCMTVLQQKIHYVANLFSKPSSVSVTVKTLHGFVFQTVCSPGLYSHRWKKMDAAHSPCVLIFCTAVYFFSRGFFKSVCLFCANFCTILSIFCTYFVCKFVRLIILPVLFCKLFPSLPRNHEIPSLVTSRPSNTKAWYLVDQGIPSLVETMEYQVW